jgi:hypothetical protein
MKLAVAKQVVKNRSVSQPPKGSEWRPASGPFNPGGLTIRVYRKTGLISNGWPERKTGARDELPLTMKNDLRNGAWPKLVAGNTH